MSEFIRNMYSFYNIIDAPTNPLSFVFNYFGSLLASHDTNDSDDLTYPDADQPRIKQALKILRIDTMIDENGTDHRTKQYDHMKHSNNNMLIIRRGQAFYLTLFMDRDFSPEKDGVSLVFQLAGIERPGIGAGTEVVIPVDRVRPPDELHLIWHAWVAQSGEKTMEIRVFPSPKCIVGEWNMRVETKLQTQRQGDSYNFPGTVVTLFNPWSEYDQVYLEEEELRQAYVLRDYGYLYRGSYDSFGSTPWIFGQFQKDVTSCALMLISSLYPVASAMRNDALQVARRLSAILHNANGIGVLHGKWDEDGMHDGRHPSSWTGSPEILTEYYRTRKAVKYGQCAVYSGIFTTVCRAIGIPCRPITNFASAHPEDNMKIHMFLDESGQLVRTKGHVWNYHAWNEMWVKRPDISTSDHNYNGWNVIDATPQERSDGVYQCGATSVKAVKLGDVLKNFDTRFIYEEVNSDVHYWLLTGNGRIAKFLNITTDMIGKLIVTQAIGSHRSIDITDSYKFPEGSQEERDIYNAAVRKIDSSRPRSFRYIANGWFNWIKCKLVMPNSSLLGSPLQVKLKVRNKSDETLTVKVFMTLSIQSYTGEHLRHIKTLETYSIEIDSKQEHEQLVEALFDEYCKLILSEDDVLHASYLASVPDKDYDFGGVDTAVIEKSQLDVTINSTDDVAVYRRRMGTATSKEELDTKPAEPKFRRGSKKNELTLTARFKNPLPVKLTGGVFKFAGPQESTVIEVKTNRDIEPNEEFSQSTIWENPGEDVPSFMVVALFLCNEVKCIRGFLQCQQEDLYET